MQRVYSSSSSLLCTAKLGLHESLARYSHNAARVEAMAPDWRVNAPYTRSNACTPETSSIFGSVSCSHNSISELTSSGCSVISQCPDSTLTTCRSQCMRATAYSEQHGMLLRLRFSLMKIGQSVNKLLRDNHLVVSKHAPKQDHET